MAGRGEKVLVTLNQIVLLSRVEVVNLQFARTLVVLHRIRASPWKSRINSGRTLR